MIRFLSAFLVAVFALAFASSADAQFKTKTVINPPGLFNRTTVKTNSNIPVGVNVNAAGVRVNAHGFNNFHGNNFNNFNNGFVGVNVNGFNAVAFNGRRNNGFVAANVGFGVPANVGFNGSQVLFVDRNKVRFNSFGVSTQQDAFGNVFEVDAFGNARFVGNRLGSNSVVTGFVPAATNVNFGFSNGFSNGFSTGFSQNRCH